MNNIKTLIDGIKGIGTDGWDAIKTIAKFLNYLMRPGLVFHMLWETIVMYSFWICLFVSLFALVFSTLGFKKLLKFVPGSLAVYFLIQMIGSAF